jgi:exodeoxyribonuclease V alpha subunit
MAQIEELKATMVSVRYRSPERNWLIATMKSEAKEVFTATGDIPYSETEEVTQLYGEWVNDAKYGKQFKVSAAHRILPTDVAGIRNYLAASEDIKGVGPVRADKLSKHFGSKLLRILNNEPVRLSECPGISIELAGRIADGWRKDNNTRQLSIYLSKYGVSPRWAGRVLKKWCAGTAIERITKNPYSLTAIDGIGFITADEIALAMGWKKDCNERTEAACTYVLTESIQKGNTFLHEGELITGICKLTHPRIRSEEAMSTAESNARAALKSVLERKELIQEKVSDGVLELNLLYLPWLYKAEKNLAERIAELNAYEHEVPVKLDQVIKNVQEKQQIQFTTKQLDAVRGAFRNHTMVITGGPGTGKTTCTNAICQVAEGVGSRLLLCAPTGRAAKRLSEITGRSATTIHRLLQWRDDGPVYNSTNRIDADILIIDESSMLDLELANYLFEAIPDSCSVVLIGDVDQLPAIGAGNTLKDIINSGTVFTITLDTIFRQAESSLIIRNAHCIRKGEMPRFPEHKGSKENSYVMWIPSAPAGSEGGRENVEWLKEKLGRLVSTNIPAKFSEGFRPIDPIRDIQVLAPMKKNYDWY